MHWLRRHMQKPEARSCEDRCHQRYSQRPMSSTRISRAVFCCQIFMLPSCQARRDGRVFFSVVPSHCYRHLISLKRRDLVYSILIFQVHGLKQSFIFLGETQYHMRSKLFLMRSIHHTSRWEGAEARDRLFDDRPT